jgi:lysophospholipase L1-like esterase
VRVWIPTRAHPLRLLVTGDFLVGILGPLLVNEASRVAPIDGVHLTDAGAQVVSDEVHAVLKRDWHV